MPTARVNGIDLSHESAGDGAALLLLMGHEWLNPMPEAERLRAGIPDARIEVIPGGGHGFLWETPDAFNQSVLAFLARVESR